MVTFEEISKNEEINELIKNAQEQLDILGYTEHSIRHVSLVAQRAEYVLRELRI